MNNYFYNNNQNCEHVFIINNPIIIDDMTFAVKSIVNQCDNIIFVINKTFEDTSYRYIDTLKNIQDVIISLYHCYKKQIKQIKNRYYNSGKKIIQHIKISFHCIKGGVIRRL